MKRVLALLLLLAVVSAQCMDMYVKPVDTKFPGTLEAVSSCPLGDDTTLYTDFAEIAEQYGLASNCFYTDEFDDYNAANYYSLSGSYYSKAAVALCGTDPNLEALLYDSAGTAHFNAYYITEDKKDKQSSEQAYGMALNAYRNHRYDVYSFTEETYGIRMKQFATGQVITLGDIESHENIDIVPIGIGVLLLFGIGLVAYYIGKH